MPQNPSNFVFKSSAGAMVAPSLTADGSMKVNSVGTYTALGLTAPTQVKTGQGRLLTVSVIVAGTAAGAAYDSASTAGGNTAANQLVAIPNQIGTYTFGGQFFAGLVVTPGTGQTVAVVFN